MTKLEDKQEKEYEQLAQIQMPEQVKQRILAEVSRREKASHKQLFSRRAALSVFGLAAASAAAYFIPQIVFSHTEQSLKLGSLVAYAKGSDVSDNARLAPGFLEKSFSWGGGDTYYYISDILLLSVVGDNLKSVTYFFSGPNWIDETKDPYSPGLFLIDFVKDRSKYPFEQPTDTTMQSFTLEGEQLKEDNFQRNLNCNFDLSDNPETVALFDFHDDPDPNTSDENLRTFTELQIKREIEIFSRFIKMLAGSELTISYEYQDNTASYQRFKIEMLEGSLEAYRDYRLQGLDIEIQSHNQDAKDYFDYIDKAPDCVVLHLIDEGKKN